MAKLTSRNLSGGTRKVTTWPIPIITYHDTTSTPGGGKLSRNPVRCNWALISSSVLSGSSRLPPQLIPNTYA
jgi:hypothetical protein